MIMNKLKEFFIGLVLWFSITPISFCQSAEQIVRMVEANHDEYYYGHGYADDYDQAVQKAKAQLVGDISTFVSSRATGTISTETGVAMEERIHTYSNMTQLREVETIVLESGEKFHVFCYLSNASVNRMFEERKQKALNYLEEARSAEKKLMMAEALRYYYWSLLVLKTLPDDMSVTFKDDENRTQNMLIWLNRHIPSLLDDITFQPVSVEGDDAWKQVNVAVTYHGKPVTDCEYRYWTGRGYSQTVRAKDGVGIVEFSEIPTNLQFFVEYVFENDAKNIDPELRDIIQMEGKPSWKNNAHTVPSAMGKTEQKKQEAVTQTPIPERTTTPTGESTATHEPKGKNSFLAISDTQKDSCTWIMNSVKKAIATKNYASVEKSFTNEGLEMFNSMMKSGNATIIGEPKWEFLQFKDDVLCRGLTVSLKYPRSGKTIVQNVEFRLNSDGLKINSLSYTLNQKAEDDILSEDKKWDMNSRIQLMRFLQDYQTAYALKRADFLENIFSDDALIIVGVELKRAPDIERRINLNNQKQYKFVQKTKTEFISDLRRVFASAEFINLQLQDNEILKVAGKEIYGIQIRQIYTSNSYADQGYLFLVVDLRNPETPIIHVRTWQPDKDPEFGLFDLSKFVIN